MAGGNQFVSVQCFFFSVSNRNPAGPVLCGKNAAGSSFILKPRAAFCQSFPSFCLNHILLSVRSPICLKSAYQTHGFQSSCRKCPAHRKAVASPVTIDNYRFRPPDLSKILLLYRPWEIHCARNMAAPVCGRRSDINQQAVSLLQICIQTAGRNQTNRK